MKFSFQRGNFFRVIVALIATAFFIISAIFNEANRRNSLFMAGLGVILTWQQYSLYVMQKDNPQRDPDQDE